MNRWLSVSLALTLVAVGASLYVYFGRYELLADEVPVHWGINGQPDQFVPRERALPWLLIAPGCMVGMVLLTLALPWLSPRQFDVERFRRTYNYLMMLVVALFAYIQGVILAATLQAPVDIGKVLVGGVFLFFALLGNQLGKVQRNFWMGVRTPWTLASETVWIRTHRLSAWLYTAAGLVGFVCILIGVPMILCFVGFMVAVFYPILYSLWLYKRLEKQGKLSPPPTPLSEELQ
jgi:uncharacterized membrane protein